MRTTDQILAAAKAVKSVPALLSTAEKQRALEQMAQQLIIGTDEILAANDADMEAAKGKISDVMLDRLKLTPQRIEAMAEGIRQVANLPDPVGYVLDTVVRPNGMVIEKPAVPMGVIAIIYESRPNVTSDAAALALMSGSVCVLRCGSDSYRSCAAVVNCLKKGLANVGIPADIINLLDDTSRDGANRLMTAVGYVDLLIPRGGAGLIRACTENAKVPCIQTGTGICHIYVDKAADMDMALNIVNNAKTSRPSVCNAAEVCLVHRDIAPEFLPKLKKVLVDDRKEKGETPVQLRLDTVAQQYIKGTPASDTDFDTEFLDYILAVKVVDGVEDAAQHISQHSTGHSEAIITTDSDAANLFTRMVDSSSVYVNVSTRFTDGGEFGLGCEMGISTQRLHARGPMGLFELCTYKYIIKGNGQIR